MNRRTAWLSAVALVAVTASSAAAAPNRSEKSELTAIEQSAASIRHLAPLHGVRASFPGPTTFKRILLSEMQQDNPDSEIQVSQRESVLIGLIKPTDNLKTIYYSGLSTQVLGMYDYHKHILYVPNTGKATFGVERYTIAHEYTHALQDQHYNLQKLMPDESAMPFKNTDAEAAHHALTEGDAVNLENLYIQRTYTPTEVDGLIAYESHLPKGPSIPKTIEREFYFPYTTGVKFVETLYARGGMPAVDAAYHRLPASTYEIMHPGAYLKGWKPVTVAIHHVHGFESWKQTDDDVFGAFGYNVVLWQWLGATRADRVTNAYRGDRYAFLESGQQQALLMRSVWTSGKTAAAARSATIAALHKRFPALKVTSAGGGTVGVYSQGAVYVGVSGTRMTIAYGPNAATATSLGTATTD